MGYTDREMRAFSQVAYADLEKGYDYLRALFPSQKSFTIQEVADATRMLDPSADLGNLNSLTSEQLNSWKIAGVHDTNSKNGFYACIIETSPGNVAVGFRGSESMTDPSSMANDWVGADLGLLNSYCTNQQLEVHRFLNRYADQLNGYDNVAMTGHSLGGNLAEYATIMSGDYGLDDNIKQCVSLDGPGFSQEFIMANLDKITKMSGVMKHYSWSLVGAMLFGLPGVQNYNVVVSEEANTEDNEEMGVFTRHSTKYLEYDENGNLIITNDRDITATLFYYFSKGFDSMPKFMGDHVKGFLGAFMITGMYAYDCFFGENGIINQLKNIYEKYIDDKIFKPLNNFFKKIINSNKKYFRVDTVRLSEDVKEVVGLFNQVVDNVDLMYEDVMMLNGMWTGPANRAFTDKFSKEHSDIINYLSKLRKFVSLLEYDSREYNNCENKALEMIEAMSI